MMEEIIAIPAEEFQAILNPIRSFLRRDEVILLILFEKFELFSYVYIVLLSRKITKKM
jgi:hypothetical protein